MDKLDLIFYVLINSFILYYLHKIISCPFRIWLYEFQLFQTTFVFLFSSTLTMKMLNPKNFDALSKYFINIIFPIIMLCLVTFYFQLLCLLQLPYLFLFTFIRQMTASKSSTKRLYPLGKKRCKWKA